MENPAKMSLFQIGEFTLHSGAKSRYKIDCDYLADSDLCTLAEIVSLNFEFSEVVGIPRGGLRFAEALKRFSEPYHDDLPVLIVDDVLTTGKSMEEFRKKHYKGQECIGIVIFSRRQAKLPSWVAPIFGSTLF